MIARRFRPAFALALLPAAPVLAAPCTITPIASLPVTMEGLRPVVAARINGSEVRLLADSGAFTSLLSRSAAAGLGLDLRANPMLFQLRGTGGATASSRTTVRSLVLAGTALPDVDFLVGGTAGDRAGLLGLNLLGLADADYDLARGVIRLVRANACAPADLAGAVGSQAPVAIDMVQPDAHDPHIYGMVMVNGVALRAAFDTGAPRSMLTLKAAARAGVKATDPGVRSAGVAGGVGRKVNPVWIARFASFSIGSERIADPQLRFSDIPDAPFDMLLGADFFLAHRIFVAKSLRRIVLSGNGAPAFGAGDESRQRPASLAPAPDKSDLDAALKRNPADIDTLMKRATLALAAQGDATAHRAEALRDLDDVDRTAPADADLRLALADLFASADAYDRAVAQYDLWLASHRRDDRQQADALNGRCWARAMGGRDLDKALSDCNAAVGADPRAAGYRDSRGLVHLRMGAFDKAIADYDAALLLQPRIAWSLYGRGLARVRLGQKAVGDSDIAAALAIDPTIASDARRIGL